ncbi:ARM repeat-containing protein [Sparassis latifolia]|uniref:Pumilio homology domain family member 6 n=1 Tax=Sparassis crispa TaxID=139825 RepID=A0A401GQW2_9APHY|nr:Pumilio homology domain family member 6 [Sparassis crispa]GBE84550.1 Pumilio homology domain family member 6 [Sparassis crispa]
MVSIEKTSRKRPAPSQTGPKLKKAHIENAQKPPAATDKGKKRSRPVTLPLQEADTSSEESEGEADFEDDEVFDAENEDEMEIVDEATAPVKDPNAARESHKVQKALLDQRRAAKPHSALITKAKSTWTLARQKNISKEERAEHIQALMTIIRGNVKDIVFKHDASRIVQTVVKHGGEKERNEIATELQGQYKELVQSKYSKFLVAKLIRFCSSHRAGILREFQGHILRLVLHRDASRVLADTFELYANAYERALLLRDFYGKEASLFTVTAGTDMEKELFKKGLRGILEGVEGERKKRVLSALKDNLVTIFNNPDKGAVAHSVVHRALWEYLTAINGLDDGTEQEKLRREMFEICQDVLAEMVHTKDGSRIVREFIAQGTAKDRKHILKALKPHIDHICTNDDAQLVLFTALDDLDDTKLTAKSIVSEITASASSLYSSVQGRRSLLYLIAPRSRRHFTPPQIALLEETDVIRARTSKKDNALRALEIKRAASDSLLTWMAESGAEVARDKGGSLVVCEIMLAAEGDKSAASDTLLKALAAPYPSDDPATPHPVSLPHTARMYKTLLQGGHYSHATRSVEREPLFSAPAFAARFVQLVGQEATVAMALGEGAFVVAAVCEQLATGDSDERTLLKSWFGRGVTQDISAAEGKGMGLLLEKIGML